MKPSVTIFTTCKPFQGRFRTIQRNALRSWKSLGPECETIIFGAEPGVREHCAEFGFRHIPNVTRSEFGTPLLNGLFEGAETQASTDLLVFVNADIILTSDLLSATRVMKERFSQFLMIVRRWNAEISAEWDFESPIWEASLREFARERGKLEPRYGGVDVFVYRRGLWKTLPPFAIGRTRWDSALIYETLKQKFPVIDATPVVTTIHQNHDYSHYHTEAGGVLKGPEAIRNQSLIGGEEFIFTPLNATHMLTASGIRRNVVLFPLYLLRRAATLPALHPSLHRLAPFVRYFAPCWRKLRRSWAQMR
jgi:hypothetical protein